MREGFCHLCDEAPTINCVLSGYPRSPGRQRTPQASPAETPRKPTPPLTQKPHPVQTDGARPVVQPDCFRSDGSVRDPSHRPCIFTGAGTRSGSCLASLLADSPDSPRRASSWPVRPAWRNLPSGARRDRPEPCGSGPHRPETVQTSAWSRTGRFHGRRR